MYHGTLDAGLGVLPVLPGKGTLQQQQTAWIVRQMINTPLYPATLPPKLLLYLLITEVKCGKLMFIQGVYEIISNGYKVQYNT